MTMGRCGSRWGLAAFGALVIGCGSSPTDRGGVALSVVSAPTTDTIEATLDGFLVISVANRAQPVVGTTVTFVAENAWVAPPLGTFTEAMASVTDSEGGVAVEVRLGESVGVGRVVVAVPSLALVDTVDFAVQPGAPVQVCVTPADTTILVGDTVAFVAALADRRCNTRSSALPVTKLSGPITPVASGFTGTSLGAGQVTATSGSFVGVATVQVIPDGQLVIVDGPSARLARTDGTHSQLLSFVVPTMQEPSVSWNSSGTRIVTGGVGGFRVFELATATTMPASWPGGVAGTNVLWPRFGPGGAVYYSSAVGVGDWDIRKANPDGTSASILIGTGRFPGRDFFPDWSPDGSRVTLTADWEEYSKFLIRLLDASLTDTLTVDVEGSTPVWSPNGQLIAYWELGLVGVVSPDLSVNRSWDLGWRKGVSWSPGSDMLVGVAQSGRVAVVHVTSGATVTLSDLGTGADAVAWRPIMVLAP